MKKYCLTDCAKRKLNAGKRWIVEFLAALLVLIVIALGLAGASLIFGFLIQGGYFLIFGNLIGFFEQHIWFAGVVGLVIFMLGGLMLMVAGMIVYNIYEFFRNVVTNKLTSDGDYYYDYHDCKIFEECKDE